MSIPLSGRVFPAGPGTFRALAIPSFRRVWIGQLVSLTGTWMQSLASGWLVLRLTNSPFFLGWVGFCALAPVLVLALPAGVAADRLPRRETLLVVQVASLVLAATLGVLAWVGRIEPWQIATIALLSGIAGAIEIPFRQALLLDLVGREDLANAIALNSLAFNTARVLGPAIAGVLLVRFGEAPIFFINSASFLAAVAATAGLPDTPRDDQQPDASWISDMRAGLGHALADRRMRAILVLVVVTGICATPYSVLLPILARDVLATDGRGLGAMMAASGLGAIAGALLIARSAGEDSTPRRLRQAMATMGAGLILLGAAPSLAVALPLLAIIGGGMIAQLATSNTLLQLLAPEGLRGRVISLYVLAFLGMAPIGSLAAGAAAARIGVRATVAAGGAICFVSAMAALGSGRGRFRSRR